MALVLAQITDTHIGAHPGRNDVNLRAAVRLIASWRPAVDAVLLAGDITEIGTRAEYTETIEILAGLPMAIYPIVGNHDNASNLYEAFRHRCPELPDSLRLNYAVDRFTVRIVAVDTEPIDLDWLEATLRQEPNRPTLVMMHRPPFDTGIWWMDTMGLAEAPRVEALIRRYPNVELVVCGHVHRPVTTSFGHTTVLVAPSTAVQNGCDLDLASEPTQTAEPPAFALHTWTGSRFVTNLIPVGVPSTRLRDLDPAAARFVDSLSGGFEGQG